MIESEPLNRPSYEMERIACAGRSNQLRGQYQFRAAVSQTWRPPHRFQRIGGGVVYHRGVARAGFRLPRSAPGGTKPAGGGRLEPSSRGRTGCVAKPPVGLGWKTETAGHVRNSRTISLVLVLSPRATRASSSTTCGLVILSFRWLC